MYLSKKVVSNVKRQILSLFNIRVVHDKDDKHFRHANSSNFVMDNLLFFS